MTALSKFVEPEVFMFDGQDIACHLARDLTINSDGVIGAQMFIDFDDRERTFVDPPIPGGTSGDVRFRGVQRRMTFVVDTWDVDDPRSFVDGRRVFAPRGDVRFVPT